jgi:hypothetical protein
MRLIIAGGRDWRPTERAYASLHKLLISLEVEEVLSGRAGGVLCPWNVTLPPWRPPHVNATAEVEDAWRKHLTSMSWRHVVGGDVFGEWFAAAWWVDVRPFHADWTKHGQSAGPIRNREMARHAVEVPGSMCVLFPGGVGTASMEKEARAAGLEVHDWRYLR